MKEILFSAGLVGGIGLILGIVIAAAAKLFYVFRDSRIAEVEALLPGANCGGCGFAGCSALAKAMVADHVPVTQCPGCTAANRDKIAEILGQKIGTVEKKVAVVLCSGSRSLSGIAAEYNGVSDCRTASMTGGGGKGCQYGCLGYGSCVSACPFGAIEIIDGLAVVHPELCRGCGKCIAACPRKLIQLVSASVPVHVYCSSADQPVRRRKVCRSACISCRKCVRAEEAKMSVAGMKVQVNFENPPDSSIIEKAGCPVGVLQTPEEHLKKIRMAAKGDAK